jgi:Anti-sigma factor NepR
MKKNQYSVRRPGILSVEVPKIPPGSGSKKGSNECAPTDQIGRHLRCLYDDVLAQPVPGRVLDFCANSKALRARFPAMRNHIIWTHGEALKFKELGHV